MRSIRTLIAGFATVMAMLVITLSAAPVSWPDFVPAASAEVADYDVLACQPSWEDVDIAAIPEVPRSEKLDRYSAAYTVQNQPTSNWRFVADAYRLIDPHIALE